MFIFERLQTGLILLIKFNLKIIKTGNIPDMVEQLYVCVYRKDELLTISIARPSFNRQDAEAANTILTHNMIQGTEANC